jgi:hypothetical protein
MTINYCGKKFYNIRNWCWGFEPTISGFWAKFSTAMLPLKAGSWPYLPILEMAGKACQGQTLELIRHICYEEKKL